MRLAFTLRSDVELSGATAVSTSGRPIDVAGLLSDGEGEIVTDDPSLQTALKGLWGPDGRLFDVAQVNAEGERSELPKEHHGYVDVSPEKSATVVVEPDEDENDLNSLSVSKLRHRVAEAGLHAPHSLTKAELVALLEGDDDQEGSE